jgi:urease accessory protein
MKRLVPIAALLMLAAGPAIAHVGHGSTASFAAGLRASSWGARPRYGHGPRWALGRVERGPRALGLAGDIRRSHVDRRHSRHGNVPLPFVEPAILASVVALALLVALAVDLPVPRRSWNPGSVCAVSWPCAWHRSGGNAERRRIHGRLRACHGGAASCRHRVCIDDDALLIAPAVRVVGALCIPVAAALYTGILQ